MTFLTKRRSLMFGAGALGIGDFDSGETLDPQVTETKFMLNLQWQLRNNLVGIGAGGVLVPELATS